jgi:hypothetical protein
MGLMVLSDQRVARLRNGETPTLPYGTLFQVHVAHRDDESVVLLLLGELDVPSMDAFERVVAEVLSSTPRALIFDLTQSEFVSAQGFATIGRCSTEITVEIRSRTHLASRVLTALGYEGIKVFVARGPLSEVSD